MLRGRVLRGTLTRRDPIYARDFFSFIRLVTRHVTVVVKGTRSPLYSLRSGVRGWRERLVTFKVRAFTFNGHLPKGFPSFCYLHIFNHLEQLPAVPSLFVHIHVYTCGLLPPLPLPSSPPYSPVGHFYGENLWAHYNIVTRGPHSFFCGCPCGNVFLSEGRQKR